MGMNVGEYSYCTYTYYAVGVSCIFHGRIRKSVGGGGNTVPNKEGPMQSPREASLLAYRWPRRRREARTECLRPAALESGTSGWPHTLLYSPPGPAVRVVCVCVCVCECVCVCVCECVCVCV